MNDPSIANQSMYPPQMPLPMTSQPSISFPMQISSIGMPHFRGPPLPLPYPQSSFSLMNRNPSPLNSMSQFNHPPIRFSTLPLPGFTPPPLQARIPTNGILGNRQVVPMPTRVSMPPLSGYVNPVGCLLLGITQTRGYMPTIQHRI